MFQSEHFKDSNFRFAIGRTDKIEQLGLEDCGTDVNVGCYTEKFQVPKEREIEVSNDWTKRLDKNINLGIHEDSSHREELADCFRYYAGATGDIKQCSMEDI